MDGVGTGNTTPVLNIPHPRMDERGEEVAPDGGAVGMETEVAGGVAPLDLEAVRQRLLDQVNPRLDHEILAIRTKCDTQVVAISKQVQAEMRKQSALTAKLNEKVTVHQAQAERVD